MQKSILVLMFFLLVYGCMSSEVTEKEQAKEVQKSEKSAYIRKSIPFYKGVWMPALNSPAPFQSQSLARREDLINDNINIVLFGPVATYNKDGKINKNRWIEEVESLTNMINYYHEVNISVWIVPQIVEEGTLGEPHPPSDEMLANTNFLNDYDELLIELAKKLEEEQVEAFSPLNEPDYNIGLERSSTWAQRILPRIREKFKGKVIWKGALQDAILYNKYINFTGYDAIGFSTSPYNQNFDEYRKIVRNAVKLTKEWAKRDNIPHVLTSEFGAWGPAISYNEEQKAEAHLIVLEEGKELDGFVVLDHPSDGIKGTKSEELVRESFKRYG